MQRFTDNPDDISLEEYEIISNHLDAAIDMERDNREFPLHTHLVSIYLHFYTSSIFFIKNKHTYSIKTRFFIMCITIILYHSLSKIMPKVHLFLQTLC